MEKQSDTARFEIHHVEGKGYCWELVVMDGVVVDSCLDFFPTATAAQEDADLQDIGALIDE